MHHYTTISVTCSDLSELLNVTLEQEASDKDYWFQLLGTAMSSPWLNTLWNPLVNVDL